MDLADIVTVVLTVSCSDVSVLSGRIHVKPYSN